MWGNKSISQNFKIYIDTRITVCIRYRSSLNTESLNKPLRKISDNLGIAVTYLYSPKIGERTASTHSICRKEIWKEKICM